MQSNTEILVRHLAALDSEVQQFPMWLQLSNGLSF